MAHAENEHSRIRQLIADAQNSRERLSDATRDLGNSLKFSTKIRASIRENLPVYAGGALVLGVVVAGMLFRPRKVVVERHLFGGQASEAGKAKKNSRNSMIIAAAGLLFQVARPILQKMLTERVAMWADPRTGQTHVGKESSVPFGVPKQTL